MRKIIHVDMDAFYAAIEQRDDPTLRGQPIAVGSARQSRGRADGELRGAAVRRALGHAVEPGEAPVPGSPLRPAAIRRLQAGQPTDPRDLRPAHRLIEPLSLDEAYLDVTEPMARADSAMGSPAPSRRPSRPSSGLTASAGVSFNKFLAKIASDLEKPDGLTVIRPAQALAFLAALPIERFHGIGPATARRMRALGIACGADLQACGEHELVQAFGRIGGIYYRRHGACQGRPSGRARSGAPVPERRDDLRARSARAAVAPGSLGATGGRARGTAWRGRISSAGP